MEQSPSSDADIHQLLTKFFAF